MLQGETDVSGCPSARHSVAIHALAVCLWKVWQLSADGALVGQHGRELARKRAYFRTCRGDNTPRLGGAGRRRGASQWGDGGLPPDAGGDIQGPEADSPRGLCL